MASASVCTSMVEPSAKWVAVGRVERDEVEPLLELLPDGRERLGQQVRHREHRRAGVDPVGARRRLQVQRAGPAAGAVGPLDDRDAPAGAEQVQRGGQPARPAPTTTT